MAWDRDEFRRDDDDEGEDITENDYIFQKEAVLFAIDVSDSMLAPPPASDDKKADKDSGVTAALKCAYQLMQQRISSQPKDMTGVLLYGTEKSKFQDNGNGQLGNTYPHCYLLTDLDVPSAQTVKALKLIAEEGVDEDGILKPSKEPISMSSLLDLAIQLFTTKTPNFGSRRLFIITDNDSPHGGNKNEKTTAAVRAKDLFDTDGKIELYPITRDEKSFDLTKFYDDIVFNPDVEGAISTGIKTCKSGDGLSLLKSLISNITSRQPPKRSLFSNIPFEIAPGLKISIKGYMPLHKQTAARTQYIYDDGEKCRFATVKTTKVELATGRTLEKAEVQRGFKFGQEIIPFSEEEMKALKTFDEKPVLRVIGFKPRSMLPMWASLDKSTFIYPSEEGYVGSTRVFSALWQKLLKDDKMGIAWHVSRRGSLPKLVAIIPSNFDEEEEAEGGISFPPSGLWLYPLPFADDVRSVDVTESERCSDELIDKMQIVIQNLQLPKGKYAPQRYPNPALQWLYKLLQSMALEDDYPEQDVDVTVPKYRQIDKRVGGYLAEWKQDVLVAAKTTAFKREAEDGDVGPLPKRPKPTPTSSTSLSNAQLKLVYDNNELGKMKVVELKDVLTSKGLSSSGKKAELVERLEQWIESHL